MSELVIPDSGSCRWDILALGEVMLRLDPGEGRIWTARHLNVWEGGGEYNVARGLRRCFGKRAAILTALADNPVGRLVEDLILQGGVDTGYIRWVDYDGVGREARNGLNFTERGFGIRPALGCSDRGHTAVSQLKAGDIEMQAIFERDRTRWFHTGGIFAALSSSTPAVAQEAMEAARASGAVVSYDLNYRPSLWKATGGPDEAQRVNRELARHVDVIVGGADDYYEVLGIEAPNLESLAEKAQIAFPNLKLVAVTIREGSSACRNHWRAICYCGGRPYASHAREDLDIFDRVGGGDSFASGLIYGLMEGKGPQWAVECGAAHGALAMTTPGDTTMATLAEVERAMQLGPARMDR